MHLGRRAVDFIGQQQIGKHRAQRSAELAGLLVVDARADQVCRHQVGCELYAFEVAAHGAGQGLDRECFSQAGHALDQQMALRQDGDHDPLQEAVLPNHHAFDFIEDLLHQLGGVLVGGGGIGTK